MSGQLVHELLNYIKSLDLVGKMPLSLTEEQAKHLLEEYPLVDIKKQLEQMNNWKDILKRRSVYATILNWFERDVRKGLYVRPAHPNLETKDEEVSRKAFLETHPVGSELLINGVPYEVESSDFLRNISNGNYMTIAGYLFNNNIKKESNETDKTNS